MHYNFKSKYYFINKLNTKNIDKLDNLTIVIYRNYSLKNEDEELITKIKRYCKKRKIRFYLANNIKKAIKLNLDGAYIPSFNRDFKHLNYSLKKNFDVIGSAHTQSEIKIKELQGVKKIVLSSLFKKNKNYLGINKFKLLSKKTKKKVICLGGVSKENLKKLKMLNFFEFAGISYFE